MLRNIVVIITLLNSLVSFSQTSIVDTNRMQGYFVSYIFKDDLKNQKEQIDVMRGYIFICNKGNKPIANFRLKEIDKIEKNRDSLFLISNGGAFVSLNQLYFHNELKPIKYNASFFPSLDSYSYKDKKRLYKSTLVEVKYIKRNLTEKELINFIPCEQYKFKNKTIPVFIIEEMDKKEVP